LQTLGALIATAVMTGAVSFHLFTPLGIDPNNDGGGLFAMAVAVWLASIAYLLFHRSTLLSILTEVGRAILPGHARTVVERTSAPAKLASVQS
jgi:hypothetical protein